MSGAPFIVWSPEGPTAPVKAYEDHKSAHAVANLMAERFPGQRFMVMARSGKVISRPTDENVKAVEAIVSVPA